MTKKFCKRCSFQRNLRDERGITGLETAIVLIAFVVVASVFAFAILSTGVLSAEKSKETVQGGLSETASTLTLRGSVIARSSGGKLQYVTFQVSNASQSGEAIELSNTGTIVSYIDSNQAVSRFELIGSDPDAFGVGLFEWTARWLGPDGPDGLLLQPGERVEITVNLLNLGPVLEANDRFTIQIKPGRGAVLIIERTLPAELTPVIDLR